MSGMEQVKQEWKQHWNEYARKAKIPPLAKPDDVSEDYQQSYSQAWLRGDNPSLDSWRISSKVADRATKPSRYAEQQARSYVRHHRASKEHLLQFARHHLNTVAQSLQVRPYQLNDPWPDDDEHFERVAKARAHRAAQGVSRCAAALEGGCKCRSCRRRTWARHEACDALDETQELLDDEDYRRRLTHGEADALIHATPTIMGSLGHVTLTAEATSKPHHHSHSHHPAAHSSTRSPSPPALLSRRVTLGEDGVGSQELVVEKLLDGLAKATTREQRAAYMDALMVHMPRALPKGAPGQVQVAAAPQDASVPAGLLSLLNDGSGSSSDGQGAPGHRAVVVQKPRPATASASVGTGQVRKLMMPRAPWAVGAGVHEQRQGDGEGGQGGRGSDAYVMQELKRKVAGQITRRDWQPIVNQVRTMRQEHIMSARPVSSVPPKHPRNRPHQNQQVSQASALQRTLQRVLDIQAMAATRTCHQNESQLRGSTSRDISDDGSSSSSSSTSVIMELYGARGAVWNPPAEYGGMPVLASNAAARRAVKMIKQAKQQGLSNRASPDQMLQQRVHQVLTDANKKAASKAGGKHSIEHRVQKHLEKELPAGDADHNGYSSDSAYDA